MSWASFHSSRSGLRPWRVDARKISAGPRRSGLTKKRCDATIAVAAVLCGERDDVYPVSASSSARPRGTLRCVWRCCPSTRQATVTCGTAKSSLRFCRMRFIGYVRRRAGELSVTPQVKLLKQAGCDEIVIEKPRSRRQDALDDLFLTTSSGDTIVVTRLSRIAPGIAPRRLFLVRWRGTGRHIVALKERVDTRSRQGGQMLDDILHARPKQSPALSDLVLSTPRDPTTAPAQPATWMNEGERLRRRATGEAYLARVRASEGEWLPVVLALRPDVSWREIITQLNSTAGRQRWSKSGLMKAVRAYVRLGLAPKWLLEEKSNKTTGRPNDRT